GSAGEGSQPAEPVSSPPRSAEPVPPPPPGVVGLAETSTVTVLELISSCTALISCDPVVVGVQVMVALPSETETGSPIWVPLSVKVTLNRNEVAVTSAVTV